MSTSNSSNKENMDTESTLSHAVNANDVSLGGQKGLLSPLGDPLGKALNKGLSPVGSVVGGVAQPFGSGKSNTDKISGNTPKEDETLKPIGGKEQTGQNPLGL